MKISVNGKQRDVTRGVRVIELLEIPAGATVPRGIAVAVDGKVIPRSRLAATELADGARVEIVTAVQGG